MKKIVFVILFFPLFIGNLYADWTGDENWYKSGDGDYQGNYANWYKYTISNQSTNKPEHTTFSNGKTIGINISIVFEFYKKNDYQEPKRKGYIEVFANMSHIKYVEIEFDRTDKRYKKYYVSSNINDTGHRVRFYFKEKDLNDIMKKLKKSKCFIIRYMKNGYAKKAIFDNYLYNEKMKIAI